MSESFVTPEQISRCIPKFIPTFKDYLRSLIFARKAEEMLTRCSPDAIYARMLEGTGCANDVELGLLLGVSREEITEALQAEDFPEEWYQQLCLRHKLSPDWLMFGVGEKIFPEKKMLFFNKVKVFNAEDVVLMVFCQLRERRANARALLTMSCGTIIRYEEVYPRAWSAE